MAAGWLGMAPDTVASDGDGGLQSPAEAAQCESISSLLYMSVWT